MQVCQTWWLTESFWEPAVDLPTTLLQKSSVESTSAGFFFVCIYVRTYRIFAHITRGLYHFLHENGRPAWRSTKFFTRTVNFAGYKYVRVMCVCGVYAWKYGTYSRFHFLGFLCSGRWWLNSFQVNRACFLEGEASGNFGAKVEWEREKVERVSECVGFNVPLDV